MGETSGYAHSESEQGGETTGTGKSERGIALMSPQDFEEMDDGELVCFIGKKKRFRLKSMNPQRHPQLKKRLGMKPPEVVKAPTLALPAPAPTPKPAPLSLDPQVFLG
jgi:type IV secretory pathway TraG/TraD family ATPase VirD4